MIRLNEEPISFIVSTHLRNLASKYGKEVVDECIRNFIGESIRKESTNVIRLNNEVKSAKPRTHFSGGTEDEGDIA